MFFVRSEGGQMMVGSDKHARVWLEYTVYTQLT